MRASSSSSTVYTLYTGYTYTHMYTRLCGGGDGGVGSGPEGLILSSVIVAGQRHLCEEQTYLAQQAIHQIAPLDEVGFHGRTGERTVIKTSAGSRRRDEEQSLEKCRAKVALELSRSERTFVLERAKFFRPRLSRTSLRRPELHLGYMSRLS